MLEADRILWDEDKAKNTGPLAVREMQVAFYFISDVHNLSNN